jgi:hypothetical protein
LVFVLVLLESPISDLLISDCIVSLPIIMRFHDWDILLFPSNRAAHIPLKEFRVACHVVHENELSHTHGSLGLPTMTCFVPSLSAGTLFYISIHCWDDPNVSRFTSAYSKQPESAQFEARVSIDGHLVAYVSKHPAFAHSHLLIFAASTISGVTVYGRLR